MGCYLPKLLNGEYEPGQRRPVKQRPLVLLDIAQKRRGGYFGCMIVKGAATSAHQNKMPINCTPLFGYEGEIYLLTRKRSLQLACAETTRKESTEDGHSQRKVS
ncbi:hypothetical protein TcWFU_009594 [Taenia crassiceps]|uniref:Uncharacterized protein n=1 Tax=Taenia crassiceps TaxID=6207 RepID=A0ABR4QNJ0_9CEST